MINTRQFFSPLPSSPSMPFPWKSIMRFGKGRFLGGVVLCLSLVISALFMEKGPLESLRLGLFDSYQVISPRQRESAPVTIVAIDEKSLARYGQWPWPRDLTAQLLIDITNAGPISMGLDIIMAEPDRLSPDKMDWVENAPSDVKSWIDTLPNNDETLAGIIEQIPVAMGIAGLEEGGINQKAPLAAAQENGVSAQKFLRDYTAELRSLPVLDNPAWGHGLLSVDPDKDGVVRRIPLAANLGDRIAPSLDLEVLRLAVGANWFTLNGSDAGISSISVGGLDIPTQKDSSIWIHYTPSDSRRFVSAADVMDGSFDPEMLANKLVLIGVTGLGLIDYPATPVASRMSGVEVRAQLLENIFEQKLLSRPVWTMPIELGLLAFLGIIFMWIVPLLPPKISPIIWIATLGGSAVGGFMAYDQALFLIDVATPVVGASLTFFTLLAAALVESDIQNKLFKQQIEIQREKEVKFAGELEGAKRIQMGILPDASSINDDRVDVGAFLEPAKDVGGDLYDLFKVDDDNLFFLVGDVAGKGIPASLFMALGKSLYKSSVLRRETDIATIMTEANAEISRDNPEMLFITAFAGILNLKTGELQYCNAGHDAPHIFTRGGDVAQLDGVGGPPLCVLDDMEYPGEIITLTPGQSLLIITDGVTEAMNDAGELYTAERLDDYVKATQKDISADDMIQGVFKDVKMHADGADPSDDITLLALTWHGP